MRKYQPMQLVICYFSDDIITSSTPEGYDDNIGRATWLE